MHYIEYHPGTIARITDKPTRHGHEDVNLLSRWVNKFNEYNTLHYDKASDRVMRFVTMMSQFQLPCSS